MFAVLKEAGKVGEKICVCLRLGKYVPLFDILLGFAALYMPAKCEVEE